jgi:hypothetical protein
MDVHGSCSGVGNPAGPDAEGLADAVAEDVADAGFGFGDAVGPG